MQAPPPSPLPSPDHPEAALAAVVALRLMADRLESSAVAAALEQGWSWAQIAQAGIQADMPPASPLTAPQPRAFHAQPSGQSLVQALAHARKGQPGPLLGAHVVALVAAAPQGVATRTLKALRLDPAALVQAAQRESAYPPA